MVGGVGQGWCVMGLQEMNPQEASGCGLLGPRAHRGTHGHPWSRSCGHGWSRWMGSCGAREAPVYLFSPQTLCVTLHRFTSLLCCSFLIYKMGGRILASISQGHLVKIGASMGFPNGTVCGGGWQSPRCHRSLLSMKTAVTTA